MVWPEIELPHAFCPPQCTNVPQQQQLPYEQSEL